MHIYPWFLIFSFLFLSCSQSPPSRSTPSPIPVKVVIVSMFEKGEDVGDRPGEFQYWVERLPLEESMAFPQGYRDLRFNREKGVLGIVTGVGIAKASASIMALGMDQRFDLSRAYWLVAGIAGVDPEDASVGSAAWAEWLVDGDIAHEIDPRESPKGWSTGYIPLRLTHPYEQPVPENDEGAVYQLDPQLTEWAYQLTQHTQLEDTEEITALRAQYTQYPKAQLPPFVLKGDQLAASTYWHGRLLNDWANNWTSYWTREKGNFVTSAMEDTGTRQSLEFLQKAGRVDARRLMVLRTASNYTMQYQGIDAYTSLAGEKLGGSGYSAYIPALESAWRVGSTVVNELVTNWDQYKDHIPGR
ncbi:MAG: purine nucleoside permease [Bacteroidota bacterium]